MDVLAQCIFIPITPLLGRRKYKGRRLLVPGGRWLYIYWGLLWLHWQKDQGDHMAGLTEAAMKVKVNVKVKVCVSQCTRIPSRQRWSCQSNILLELFPHWLAAFRDICGCFSWRTKGTIMIIMNFNFIFYIGLFYLTSDNWGKGILPPSLVRPPDKDLCWKVVRYGYWRLIVVALQSWYTGCFFN